MRMVLTAVTAALALAACGGGSGDDSSGDDDGGIDGGGDCGAAVCEAGACGVVYRDGCAPLDCGLCRYDGAVIDAEGTSSSMTTAGGAPLVAYVAPDGQGGHEVRLAALAGSSWSSEVVAPALASGGGGTSTSVLRTASGAVWIAWSDTDPEVFTAHRDGSGPWTVDVTHGRGVRPQLAELGDGTVLVAYAGIQPSGIQLRRYTGGAWSPPAVVAADDAYALALAARGTAIHVAWRDDDQDARYARSVDGGAFTVEDLVTGVGGLATDATIALALDESGAPHVAYSVQEDTTVHARRSGDAWERTELGRTFGQGGGTALTVGSRVHVAHMDAFALQLADASGGTFAEQTVDDRCDEGPVAVGLDGGGALHVVHACASDEGVSWLRRRAERFPDGWHAACEAIADTLYTTACSCAPDPQRPECCITATTPDGTSRHCSAGQSVRLIAYAAVCGDPTVEPSILDACGPAAGAVACTSDGDEGNATVPAACLPPP
jgi:hypothetical protein